MKLWGGRFDSDINEHMRRFNDSFGFDRRLYDADIRGSIAYAGALHQAAMLPDDEHQSIVDGLGQVKAEFDSGDFVSQPSDEDIHTAVERRLTEIIGPAGGKLHTGRSRNDQVATDLRLWLMDEIDLLQVELQAIQRALVDQAEAHLDLILPGYTHLQPAQPILFSHWLMGYFWMLERDRARLSDCRGRTAICPLGSGALAGNPFPIDRHALAEALDMNSISPNSLDAVSDRDFAAEFLFAAAMVGIHISRLAEDLIIFSSPGYRFLKIGEAFTTGSSLMPQKRNPDSMELARGKSGRLIGSLMGMLTTLKGLPSTYNKDMQEDKEPLFDAVDTLHLTLPVVGGVIVSITPDGETMRAALSDGMLATDLADYLVAKSLPFREAHKVAGNLVREAENRKIALSKLPFEVFQEASDLFAEDVFSIFDFDEAVARRDSVGGTAPEQVKEQIKQARRLLN